MVARTKLEFLTPRTLLLPVALLLFACAYANESRMALAGSTEEAPGRVTQGALVSFDEDGQPGAACPLKHTAVNAEISGLLARVTVTQQFKNNRNEKIEAVYVFPLPRNAAVDDMTMKIGDRVVKGKIKRREEARAIYEAAKARGHVASLLDQERPNIFTQAVANIPPGAAVDITISYVETLRYEEGTCEFSFPMVVGPRYVPGNPTGASGGGWSPDTDQVPDASKITPPVAKPGTRAGHDISISVKLDAGLPVDRIASKTHEVDIEDQGPGRAWIRLRKKDVLPNKDFILTCRAAGAKIEDAVLAHSADRGGFFTLILQPPERVTAEDVTPKELVFVLDTSGSMSGFPIEKAKEVIDLALNGMYPRDTFNLITFAGDTHLLFPAPRPATNENVARAKEFLRTRQGGGGTEMMKAIRTALAPSDSQEHVRIVCFLTDGYVGNDMAIIGELQRHANARVFSFGIGSSVNRFLLDKMAEEGRGEVEYVALNDDGSAAARRFHERVRNPLLTDVRVDWGGLPVEEVYPRRIPDLFSAKPVVISGRYKGPARGAILLKGKMSGRDVVRTITVDFPSREPEHDVLATLWARRKADHLMSQDWAGMQSGQPRPELREEVTQLGLEYRLMTQFTSFVAVEETIVTEGGQPRRIDVPVEMPEGVSYEGVFGEAGAAEMKMMAYRGQSGMGGGVVGGIIGGVPGGSPQMTAVAPPPPARPVPESGAARNEAWTRPDAAKETIETKLHPDLRKLAGGVPVSAVTVWDGKAEVEVWLEETSGAALAELKRLGFVASAEPKIAKVVIGWLPVERLEEAARLSGVRYVTPHRQG